MGASHWGSSCGPFLQDRKAMVAGRGTPLACSPQFHCIWALDPSSLNSTSPVTVLPPPRNHRCCPRDQQRCPPLPSLALSPTSENLLSSLFLLGTLGLLTFSPPLSGLLLFVRTTLGCLPTYHPCTRQPSAGLAFRKGLHTHCPTVPYHLS